MLALLRVDMHQSLLSSRSIEPQNSGASENDRLNRPPTGLNYLARDAAGMLT